MGKLLRARERLRHFELALFARLLGAPTRTLHSWRGQAECCAVMGRPPPAEETWRGALPAVACAWKRQELRPRTRVRELERMGVVVPVTIVRGLLRALKARWERVQERKRQAEQGSARRGPRA